MRLSSAQQEAIVAAFQETFHAGTRLILFGSRTDDAARGGDIDLCVESGPETWNMLVRLRQSFEAKLMKRLGERKIDVVLRRQGDPERPIDQEIDRKGIELCWIPC